MHSHRLQVRVWIGVAVARRHVPSVTRGRHGTARAGTPTRGSGVTRVRSCQLSGAGRWPQASWMNRSCRVLATSSPAGDQMSVSSSTKPWVDRRVRRRARTGAAGVEDVLRPADPDVPGEVGRHGRRPAARGGRRWRASTGRRSRASIPAVHGCGSTGRTQPPVAARRRRGPPRSGARTGSGPGSGTPAIGTGGRLALVDGVDGSDAAPPSNGDASRSTAKVASTRPQSRSSLVSRADSVVTVRPARSTATVTRTSPSRNGRRKCIVIARRWRSGRPRAPSPRRRARGCSRRTGCRGPTRSVDDGGRRRRRRAR